MTLACALLTLLYVGLEVCAVRPYLWPAGTGASIAADPATRIPLFARPPPTSGHPSNGPVASSLSRQTARPQVSGSDRAAKRRSTPT
jgi:hypothetical protein